MSSANTGASSVGDVRSRGQSGPRGCAARSQRMTHFGPSRCSSIDKRRAAPHILPGRYDLPLALFGVW
jgi:hypothetical protein